MPVGVPLKTTYANGDVFSASDINDTNGTINIIGNWTSYTPTYGNFTLGNGTVTARYSQIGKTVSFTVKIVLGSTSSVGTEPSISFPIAAANTTAANSALILFSYQDSGTAYYTGQSIPIANSTTTFRLMALDASAATVRYTNVTATAPFTWGNTDEIYVSGSYEAA